MNVQVIMRDGQPEYAVLPWAEYQALLQGAGQKPAAGLVAPVVAAPAVAASLARLATLRAEKGLSVEQLAQAVGISPHYLALIEQGEREPSAVIERVLAQVLGVSAWEAES